MTTKQPDWEAIERAYRAGSLSIRTIAERHGARLVLDKSERLGGLCVRVEFPQAEKRAF